MNNLNVVIMGQNCRKFLPMCLKSVESADEIIYCDGGSTDGSVGFARQSGAVVIENEYIQKDKGMNGIQRNYYLNYLKKFYKGEWVLALDADEVVDDLQKIKTFVNNPPEDMTDIISVRMRHFIENLGQEDATVETHFVPHRLFKIREELFYSETEHSVLQEKGQYTVGEFSGATIWHLAYCPGIFDIRKRYLNHVAKSEMHPRDYLNKWYESHLFGVYPKKGINVMEVPDVILKEFLIDKDMIYFSTHKTLETKHFIMAKQWIDNFNPKTVLDLGCGVGLFGYALDSYGIAYRGIEKSKWAIDNTLYKHLNITQGDITKKQDSLAFDLVLVLDVLEHLNNEDELDVTLNNIKDYGNIFLFSIPYLGDPNLDLDITHKIKQAKEWWVNKLSKYFKISDVPIHFMYGKQMLMGEKK